MKIGESKTMKEKYFINEFVTLGLQSFFNNDSENPFERHVIECLVDIYGKEKLKRIYDEKNESKFIDMIYSYKVSHKVYDNFLRDTFKFEDYKREKVMNSTLKTDVACSIEISLITMFLHKSIIMQPSLEEISHFENNLLNDFSIIKFHFNNSLNPNHTREAWEKKKKILYTNVELEEIKPEFLDEFTYARFGIDIENVKDMDNKMVLELNKYIKNKLLVVESETVEKTKPKLTANTVISSGNGYVDALLMIGIIATEFSIGLIYLFLNL